ncbi:MAG: hypothetical protein HOH65_06305 [Rhodospirillaceae bacterium]|nr:hypothetical protein [Rhodospirillaceae bacterium]
MTPLPSRPERPAFAAIVFEGMRAYWEVDAWSTRSASCQRTANSRSNCSVNLAHCSPLA